MNEREAERKRKAHTFSQEKSDQSDMITDLREDITYVEVIQIVEVCGEVILIVFLVFMFIICNAGFSVYHALMWDDDNSSYFLLNIFYQHFAVVVQCCSILLLSKVRDKYFEMQKLNSKIIFQGFNADHGFRRFMDSLEVKALLWNYNFIYNWLHYLCLRSKAI